MDANRLTCEHYWHALYVLGSAEVIGYICPLCGRQLTVDGFHALLKLQARERGLLPIDGMRLYEIEGDCLAGSEN